MSETEPRDTASHPPPGDDASARSPLWALPSQTMGRFLVLVTAVLGASAFAYEQMGVTAARLLERRTCLLDHPTVGLSSRDYATAIDARSECLRSTDLQSVRDMLLGMGLTMAGALVVYWLLPFVERWVRRLRPLRPDVHAEILAELTDIAAEAGLRRGPVFLHSLSPRVNANTFGWFPRYYVRLDGGLLTTFTTDRQAFRALIRHEMAHLRFRDVDITRLTIALGVAFPLAVLAPYGVTVAAKSSWQNLGADSWRLAVLAVLVFVTMASVLRGRELAADAWAARGGAERAAELSRVLTRQEQSGGAWWRVGEFLGAHPTARRRVAELARPRALLRVGPWESAAVGAAAGIAGLPLWDLFTWWYHGEFSRATLAAFTSMMILSVFTTGVMGPALWRGTLNAAAGGTRPTRGTLSGFGLGLGVLAGYQVAWPEKVAQAGGSGTVIEVTFAVLLILTLMLYCRWIVTGAQAWLPTVRRSARAVFFAGFPAMVVVCAVPLALHLEFRQLGYAPTIRELAQFYNVADHGGWSIPGQLVLLEKAIQQNLLAAYPGVILGTVLICLLYPLAAWFRVGDRLFDPWTSIAAGAAGGLAYALVVPFLWLEYTGSLTDVRLPRSVLPGLSKLLLIFPAALVQASVAAVVAVTASRLGTLRGLLAALTAGALQTLSLLLVASTDGCWTGAVRGPCAQWFGWGDAELWTGPLLIVAPFLALIAAVTAAGVASIVRRRLPEATEQVPSPAIHTGPPLRTRWAVSSVIVVTALIPTVIWAGSRVSPLKTDTATSNCLVGTWTMQSTRYEVATTAPGSASQPELVTTRGPLGDTFGKRIVFRPDGTSTSTYDFRGQGTTTDGRTLTISIRGVTDQRWEAPYAEYRMYDVVTRGYRVEVSIDGKPAWSAAPPDGPSAETLPGRHTCDDHELELLGKRGVETYRR